MSACNSGYRRGCQNTRNAYFVGRRAKAYFKTIKAIDRIGIAPVTLRSLAYWLLKPNRLEMRSVGLMAASENTPEYSSVAAWHDSTRNIPTDLLSENYERISVLTGLDSTWRVLDVCCGTGQLAMPLLASGFEVVGIDVSSDMLSRGNRKFKADWRGDFVCGDARNLGFTDGCFDAAIISRFFLHIGNLQQVIAETVRVLRPEGLVIVIEGRGAFSHTARRLFRAEADRRGYARRMQDDQDRDTIAAHFAHLGATRLRLDVSDLTWTKTLTYRECLEHLRSRFYAEFWLIPEAEYDDILHHVGSNLEGQPGGLDTTDSMTPSLHVDLYVTPASP